MSFRVIKQDMDNDSFLVRIGGHNWPTNPEMHNVTGPEIFPEGNPNSFINQRVKDAIKGAGPVICLTHFCRLRERPFDRIQMVIGTETCVIHVYKEDLFEVSELLHNLQQTLMGGGIRQDYVEHFMSQKRLEQAISAPNAEPSEMLQPLKKPIIMLYARPNGIGWGSVSHGFAWSGTKGDSCFKELYYYARQFAQQSAERALVELKNRVVSLRDNLLTQIRKELGYDQDLDLLGGDQKQISLSSERGSRLLEQLSASQYRLCRKMESTAKDPG